MIDIFNINAINKGDLLASCSVEIKPWKIKFHNIMVFQKGVNRWVSLPREKYESMGETKYRDFIEFTDTSAHKRFRDQILAAVDDYIDHNGSLEPEDVIKPDAECPW